MTDQILALLTAERDRLQNAIDALGGTAKRRGRPPGSRNKPAGTPVLVDPAKFGVHRKRQRTPAERKAQSLRMKKLWEKRKAAAA